MCGRSTDKCSLPSPKKNSFNALQSCTPPNGRYPQYKQKLCAIKSVSVASNMGGCLETMVSSITKNK